jgi:hemolysin activation/secretion protein
MQLAYTHSYFATTWDGYATLTYHRGLNWFGAYSGSDAKPVFNKYTLDLNYNRQLSGEGVPARYSFSLHGQYAKEGIIGSEQIGMGGPYSVRGFKSEGQLSGNRGLYIRNELSLNQKISHGYFSPYLALDYGIVSRNDQSNGGRILGIAMGTRVNFYKWALDFYRSIPILYANNLGVHHDNGFVGFNLSYTF